MPPPPPAPREGGRVGKGGEGTCVEGRERGWKEDGSKGAREQENEEREEGWEKRGREKVSSR